MAREDDDEPPRPLQWTKPEVAEGRRLDRRRLAAGVATIVATLALLATTITYAIVGLLTLLHGRGAARLGGAGMCAAPLLLVLPVVALVQARRGGRNRLWVALALDAISLGAAFALGAGLRTVIEAL